MLTAVMLGTVVKDADTRVSAKGTRSLSVTLRDGDGDAATFVLCSIFGTAAEEIGAVQAGDALYVEGRLTLSTYTARDGQERTGLQMACHHASRPAIGRHKPKPDPKPKPAARPAHAVGTMPSDFDDGGPGWLP